MEGVLDIKTTESVSCSNIHFRHMYFNGDFYAKLFLFRETTLSISSKINWKKILQYNKILLNKSKFLVFDIEYAQCTVKTIVLISYYARPKLFSYFVLQPFTMHRWCYKLYIAGISIIVPRTCTILTLKCDTKRRSGEAKLSIFQSWPIVKVFKDGTRRRPMVTKLHRVPRAWELASCFVKIHEAVSKK